MNATLNTFPPLHVLPARVWLLAAIALLHLGFFWALSSGLAVRVINAVSPPLVVTHVPDQQRPAPEPVPTPEPLDRRALTTKFDVPIAPTLPPIDDAVTAQPSDTPTPPWTYVEPAPAPPVIVEPRIDPRFGLSEPVYPPGEIRLQHTGTVILSVQVLPNGRVGEVRIEQSSGYRRLDDSAAREARRWRFLPGTRDNVATTMWKQVPITFRLED